MQLIFPYWLLGCERVGWNNLQAERVTEDATCITLFSFKLIYASDLSLGTKTNLLGKICFADSYLNTTINNFAFVLCFLF